MSLSLHFVALQYLLPFLRYTGSKYENTPGTIMKRCGVECGVLLLPGLLFADDTSLFGEDVEGWNRVLWCWRNGVLNGG